MKIYIALVQDRHTDASLRAFVDKNAAIAWAREELASSVHRPEEIVEETIPAWVFYIRYGEDGDYAYVTESELIA